MLGSFFGLFIGICDIFGLNFVVVFVMLIKVLFSFCVCKKRVNDKHANLSLNPRCIFFHSFFYQFICLFFKKKDNGTRKRNGKP